MMMLLIATVCVNAQNTFRNTKWGMTIEQVKLTEKGLRPTNVTASTITYNVEVQGYKGLLIYDFHKNHLFRAMYHFESSKNPNLNSKKFDDILNEKYGPKPELKTYKEIVSTIAAWKDGATEIQSIGNDENVSIMYYNKEFIDSEIISIIFKGTEELRGVKMLSTKNEVKQIEINSKITSSSDNSISCIIDKEWAKAIYNFNTDGKLYSKSIIIEIIPLNRSVFHTLRDYIMAHFEDFKLNKSGKYYPIGYSANLPNMSTLTIEVDERFRYITITEKSKIINNNNTDF